MSDTGFLNIGTFTRNLQTVPIKRKIRRKVPCGQRRSDRQRNTVFKDKKKREGQGRVNKKED